MGTIGGLERAQGFQEAGDDPPLSAGASASRAHDAAVKQLSPHTHAVCALSEALAVRNTDGALAIRAVGACLLVQRTIFVGTLPSLAHGRVVLTRGAGLRHHCLVALTRMCLTETNALRLQASCLVQATVDRKKKKSNAAQLNACPNHVPPSLPCLHRFTGRMREIFAAVDCFQHQHRYACVSQAS